MEHLSTPNNPYEDSQVKVPYFCHETFQPSHATVFTYPALRGYDRENFISNLELTPDTFRDFEGFLQEWLYFVFLHQVFRAVGVEIDHWDFVCTDDNGRRVLTTSKLLGYIEQWNTANNIALYEEVARSRQELNECIREVQSQCERLHGAGLASTPIILAILILGETLSYTRSSIYHEEIYDLWPNCSIPSLYMCDNGWCPNKIAMLEKLYSNASLYYLSMVKQTDGSQRSHDRCTRLACNTHNIDRETYQSRHVQPHCMCEFAGPNEHDIKKCIDHGGWPIVSFHNDQLKVIQAGQESCPDYIAISHVWSDGMGNLHGNKLPLCQLQKLNEMVTKLKGGTSNGLFWMDTLCVPWINDEENRRRKAIGRMKDTYANATDVLVISTDFTTISCDINPCEALLRIASSGWMRRLWTLQEGALAQDLHFQFLGRALDFSKLKAAIKARLDSSFIPVQSDALQCGSHFQYFKHLRQNQIEEIHNALQWRNTSWADDEPLCLAILLDLDAEKIANTEGEDRMWTLLGMLRTIPTQLMFAPGDRISRAGFRWAPKSIMNREGYTMKLGNNSPPAIMGPLGLIISMPGFRLSPRLVPNRDICLINCEDGSDILTVYNLGKHDGGVSWKEIGPWNVENPAIIYQPELDMGLTDAYGALVSVYQEVDEVMLCNFISRVQIHREQIEVLRDILSIAWSRNEQNQDESASIRVAETLDKGCKWCIR